MHSRKKGANGKRKPREPRRRTAPRPAGQPQTQLGLQNRKAPATPKDLEQLQEAALVSHKRKQEDAERLRIMSQNQKEREEIAQRHREREAKEQAEAAAAQRATATEEVLAPRTSSMGAIAKTGTSGRTDAPRVPYDVNDPAYHRINPNDMDDMVSITLQPTWTSRYLSLIHI